MNREDIIRMAKEAGFELDCCSLEWHSRIRRFAALVAAHEREACAKLCETDFCGDDVAYYVATAIRARGDA